MIFRLDPTRFLGVLLFLGAAWALSAEPKVEFQTSGEPGGYIILEVVESGTPRALRAELEDSAGDVLSDNVLFKSPDHDGPTKLCILAIPHHAQAGRYFIVTRARDGEALSRTAVAVTGRPFLSETISLDRPMSDLRQSEDPRRIEESRLMWGLLNRKDPKAAYHVGNFRNPLAESIRTSSFGDRRLFVYSDGATNRSVHSGIDLAAPKRTPVMSSGRGRVVFSGERLITGNTVVIEHLPGVYSLYYHLDQRDVSEGDSVGVGQVIGLLGDTGVVTGAHLHWEFRVGGIPVDPDAMAGFELPLDYLANSNRT